MCSVHTVASYPDLLCVKVHVCSRVFMGHVLCHMQCVLYNVCAWVSAQHRWHNICIANTWLQIYVLMWSRSGYEADMKLYSTNISLHLCC